MFFLDYPINNRTYTYRSSLAHEFHVENGKNYLFDLSYLSALSILGERAAEFLQGQISADLNQVTFDKIQQAVTCNLQGRVLALFDVMNWQGFKMILPKDLLSATQVSLNKTALLSRVKLDRESPYVVYGFYQTNADDRLPTGLSLPSEPLALTSQDKVCCYSLGKSFYVLLINKEQVESLTEPFLENQQLRGSLGWHHLRLQHKAVQIYPNTRGLFLPHRLDLHRSGHLNFNKGCYKGQEIVARIHYRAKQKHQLTLFTITTAEPLVCGNKLFDSSGKNEVGELIDYCPMENQGYLIAVSILNEHPDTVLIESHSKPVRLSSTTSPGSN